MTAPSRKGTLVVATAVAAVVVLTVVLLCALRAPLARTVIEWALRERGFPDASVRIESVRFDGAQVGDVVLVPELGPTVGRIDVRYRPGALVRGRLDGIAIEGLRLRLDLTGEGPLLGKLEPLIEGGGQGGGTVPVLPPLELRDARLVAVTTAGPAEARLDGAVDVAREGGVDGRFQMTLQSDLASLDGTLDVSQKRDGTLEAALGLDHGNVALPQAQIAGLRGSAHVRLEGEKPVAGSADLAFDSVGFRDVPLGRGTLDAELEGSHAEAHARLDAGDGSHTLRASLSAMDPFGAPQVEADADASIRHDSTLWRVVSDRAPTSGTVSLAGMVAGSLPSASVPTGLEAATALFAEGGWTSSGQVALRGVSVATGSAAVEGLDGVVHLSSLVPLRTSAGQTLSVRKIDAGVPLGNLRMRFGLGRAKSGRLVVRIERLDATTLGGKLLVSDTAIEPQGPRNSVDVHVSDIDLGALLERIDLEGLSGSGRLAGSLPILVNKGKITIRDGRLAATGGGQLSYRSETAKQALESGGEQVDLMMRALRNFQYRDLTSGVDMDEAGYLRLSLSMEGHNPEVLEGYPFRFNINVESDVTPFLDALSTGSRISGSLLGRKWRLKR